MRRLLGHGLSAVDVRAGNPSRAADPAREIPRTLAVYAARRLPISPPLNDENKIRALSTKSTATLEDLSSNAETG
eukprot:12899796-Prorocentrum_lima.AAC.1